MDGWLENVGIPTTELNGGAGVPEGSTIFSPRNYDHKVTFEERTRTNGSLVLQFAPSDTLTLTTDLPFRQYAPPIRLNATIDPSCLIIPFTAPSMGSGVGRPPATGTTYSGDRQGLVPRLVEKTMPVPSGVQ